MACFPDFVYVPAMHDTRAKALGSGTKRFFVKTYGCQMNVYDSERMVDVLVPLGYAATDDPETADLVVLNTCHIREKAAEKVYSELGRLKALRARRRADGGDLMIAVAGCVAQAEGEEIIAPRARRRPRRRAASLSSAARTDRPGRTRPRIVDTDFPEEDKFDHLPAPQSRSDDRARGLTAFLTVQEGCDKFCTFCVVPYTRGGEISRPVAAGRRRGARPGRRRRARVTLLGQNVNAYHGVDESRRSARPGRACSRRLAAHRRPRAPALHHLPSARHGRRPDRRPWRPRQLMPYLHLPVQSGSDRILKAMNRRHTAPIYLDLVDRIRAARPDIALSAATSSSAFPAKPTPTSPTRCRSSRTVGYASAFSFKYSPRPGTPGADLPDQVRRRRQVRAPRRAAGPARPPAARLQRRLSSAASCRCCSSARAAVPVRSSAARPICRPVHAAGDLSLIGTIQPVEILGATKNSLLGKIVTLV